MITIAISADADTARIALLNGDCLTEYSIWQFNQPGDIGDIYSGRITSRVPAMAGSFVDLGVTSGFLPDSAGASGITEGGYLAAEITRCAQSGKGPRVAALDQACNSKPGLMRQSLGPLSDLAARYPAAPILIDNYHLIAILSDRCRQSVFAPLAARISYKAVTFDPVLSDEIHSFSEPSTRLFNGARMHVTVAPALTAIDIDAGEATADKMLKQQSQLALNLSLIPAIARQILIRNLSGAILIDFAGMKSAARPKLLPVLKLALAADPLNPRCLGFSHLGFAEINRPRVRPPLHEYFQ